MKPAILTIDRQTYSEWLVTIIRPGGSKRVYDHVSISNIIRLTRLMQSFLPAKVTETVDDQVENTNVSGLAEKTNIMIVPFPPPNTKVKILRIVDLKPDINGHPHYFIGLKGIVETPGKLSNEYGDWNCLSVEDMVLVRFEDGRRDAFWPEELEITEECSW